jgi:MYXO-CTERM domain-containing protein
VVAMATNASAGVIYNSQSVTAGPIASAAASNVPVSSFQKIVLKNATGANVGGTFSFGPQQVRGDGGYLNAGVVLAGGTKVDFLHASQFAFLVKDLSSGSKVSAGAGFFKPEGSNLMATQHSHFGSRGGAGLKPNVEGFAGFSFLNTVTSQKDFGWVRLIYEEGQNGAANEVTAVDWAYDDSGNSITAGAGAGTPEPSTDALALLAAGALGIAALRRRRKTAE